MTPEEELDLYRPDIDRAIRARWWKLQDVEDLISEGYIKALRALRSSPYPDRKVLAVRAALWGAVAYLERGGLHTLLSARGANEASGRVPLSERLVGLVEDLSPEGGEDDRHPWRGSEPDFVPRLLDRLEAEREVRRLWGLLSPRQREVIVRYYWLDESYAEAAAQMGLHRDQPERLASYGLNVLRQACGVPEHGCGPAWARERDRAAKARRREARERTREQRRDDQ